MPSLVAFLLLSPLALQETAPRQPSGGGFLLVDELVSPDPQSADDFGAAVAVDGELAVVLAPRHDHVATWRDQGAVYVFERTAGGSWSLVQEIVPPSTYRFGGMALDGDTLALGLPHVEGVWILRRDVESGTFEEERLATYPTGPSTFLGHSVDLEGDVLALGGPGVDWATGANRGALVVLDRNAGGPEQWGAVHTATAQTTCTGLGFDVAVSGGRVVAGQPGWTPFGECATGSGPFARVVEKAGELWSETAVVSGSFGATSVTLDGDTLALELHTGFVVYERDDAGAWIPTATGHAQPLALRSRVTLRGDRLLFGHAQDLAPGRVFVHERDRGGSDAWGRRQTLLSPRATTADRFGEGLALDGRHAVVGAPGARSAFVYRWRELGPVVAPAPGF